jgi:uncharacterized membrane protein YtjA (UPF0391 family)
MFTVANTLAGTLGLNPNAQVSKRVIYPDDRMKQAQSEPRYQRWVGVPNTGHTRRWTDKPLNASDQEIKPPSKWSPGRLFIFSIGALWFVVTLPFRLIFWIIAWMGRLMAAVLGFSLMVVGIALWAGPLFFIGIPLFLVGLILTLRCLD